MTTRKTPKTRASKPHARPPKTDARAAKARPSKTTTRAAKAPPWQRKRPAGQPRTQLTPAQKQLAAARARRAGRPYPNLVDNMYAATHPPR